MVLAACEHIDGRVYLHQINRHPALSGLCRNTQIVLDVSVAHVPTVHRPRKIGAIRIPVEDVESVGLTPFEIITDHVRPNEIVSAQSRKYKSKLAARHNATLPDRLLARGHACFVDQEPDLARFREVEHGGEKRQALDLILAARCEHRRGAAKHRAADTKAESVRLIGSGHCERHLDGAKDAEFQIVVPCQMSLIGTNVAPRDHEYRVTLLDGITYERVRGL